MGDTSLAAVPGFGVLQRVAYLRDVDLARPIGLELGFESGRVCLLADSEWDDLLVTAMPPEAGRVVATSDPLWADAIGRPCLWSWELRNQTGHVDGTQLLFAAPPDPDVCI